MSEAYGSVPLPLSEILMRINLPEGRVPAMEAIQKASVRWQLIEDYLPLSESLEFQLSTTHWVREGVRPFIEGSVPFIVNNNGWLAENSAALLFANCLETAPPDGRIVVLELGAGTGLFARYFLDQFRRLCDRDSRDFYQRLFYYITDRSPRTVGQWEERGIFRGHAGHAITLVCDANTVEHTVAEPIRAVFCNYILDSLPSAIVRKTERGWEQMAVRTSMVDDAVLLRHYTPLTFDQIRTLAASPDAQARDQLLPLLPFLEIEADFVPVGQSGPAGLERLECEPGGAAVAYNYGAIMCLESVLRLLEPHGFVLVNDYRAQNFADEACASATQRFGPAVAMGLNFPLLENHFRHCGVNVLKPEGDDRGNIHARLLLRSAVPSTRDFFDTRFAAGVRERADALVEQARQGAAAGRWREALASYRTAIERNQRDWQLIGEAAEFVSMQLKDHQAGLELAQAALELNPWYSCRLWNVLGGCLASLQRPEAHECYLQAHRIHPGDVQTNLNLAQSWLVLGDPRRSLEAVARGLANDSSAMFRHALLERQQQAIASLSIRWHAERETAARRQVQVSECSPELAAVAEPHI